MNEHHLLEAALGLLISIVGYLLQKKDHEQEKQLEDLYTKHHQDADRLHQVELKLASDHYVKSELDNRFDRLDISMKHGFETLGAKFDVLSAQLVAHITNEEIKKK